MTEKLDRGLKILHLGKIKHFVNMEEGRWLVRQMLKNAGHGALSAPHKTFADRAAG